VQGGQHGAEKSRAPEGDKGHGKEHEGGKQEEKQR
jgi:hypothetical protein